MVDTSDTVQDEFSQVLQRLKRRQPLSRPLLIWIYDESCPACATGKDNLIALAKSGYSTQVDFYLTTFHTFRSLMPRRKVEVVPTQLLFNARGVRKLIATGASVEQLKIALDKLLRR